MNHQGNKKFITYFFVYMYKKSNSLYFLNFKKISYDVFSLSFLFNANYI